MKKLTKFFALAVGSVLGLGIGMGIGEVARQASMPDLKTDQEFAQAATKYLEKSGHEVGKLMGVDSVTAKSRDVRLAFNTKPSDGVTYVATVGCVSKRMASGEHCGLKTVTAAVPLF